MTPLELPCLMLCSGGPGVVVLAERDRSWSSRLGSSCSENRQGRTETAVCHGHSPKVTKEFLPLSVATSNHNGKQTRIGPCPCGNSVMNGITVCLSVCLSVCRYTQFFHPHKMEFGRMREREREWRDILYLFCLSI